MKNLRLTLGCIAIVSCLSACVTDRTFGEAPGIEVAELAALPSPSTENLYSIGAQEVLKIEVADAERLSGEYLTDGQGRVAFPLVGLVNLMGLMPADGAERIADALRGRYLANPQIRIIPQGIPPATASVGGQVNKPGEYPLPGRKSLLRLVNLAGGVSEYAKLEDVLVFRKVNGQQYIGVYNLEAIRRGNYEDPSIFANDIIIVGDSPNRRRLDSILQFAPLLSTSAILIDRIGR